MSAMQMGLRGGDRLQNFLQSMRARAGGASQVRVGFLENATYPATPSELALHIAQVAFWNEFGTSTAPARPFFRGMINEEQDGWGDKLGDYLRQKEYDSDAALRLLGLDIKDALTQSIAQWPADNAPSTIAKKGFDHGLVDSADMQNAVDFEVLK